MPTIHHILTHSIPRLAAAGIASARLDAEVLLGHVLGKARGWLWAHPEAEVSAAEEARFRALLARRLGREPLAYLIGAWEFYGRAFIVTPEVLIPRPETELLVEAVLGWARAHGAGTVADIGTGSGAIAVTLAVEAPVLRIIAVDLSPGALAVARHNAQQHGVAARITFLEGDLLAPIRAAGLLPLDIIAANLPYIAEEEFPALMPEVREFEPELALRAGAGGLAIIRRLIADSPDALAPGGLLALELGLGQAAEVEQLLTARDWHDIRVITDYADIPRHLLAAAPDPAVA